MASEEERTCIVVKNQDGTFSIGFGALLSPDTQYLILTRQELLTLAQALDEWRLRIASEAPSERT